MIEFSISFILNPEHWQVGLHRGSVEEEEGVPGANGIALWLWFIGFQVTAYSTC
jgi:hypothetical protein